MTRRLGPGSACRRHMVAVLRAPNCMRKSGDMGILSKAKLALQNYRFKLWRLRHPQATFKDYFAAIAKDDLAHGRQHPSLGEHLKWGDRSELGGASFKRLLKYGITPQDAFVDYGCGTLRMGVHAIRFLERGQVGRASG